MDKIGLGQANYGNMARMTVDRAVDLLCRLYTGLLERGEPLGSILPPMLWGPPGIGKSQGAEQLCRRLEEQTGRKIHFHQLILNKCDPSKVEGMALIPPGGQEVIYVPPSYVKDMKPGKGHLNVLKLGELPDAVPMVQKLANSILLDRYVGDFPLPDNCIVLADGNRMIDQCATNKTPNSVANRLMHIEIESDFAGWKRWALKNGVHPAVIGFLSWQPNLLSEAQPSQADLAFPTNRTWTAAGKVLDLLEADPDGAAELMAGCVGAAAAGEFRRYWKVYDKLPSMEAIFQGRAAKIPTSPDALYGVIAGMAAYAAQPGMALETAQLANSIRYAMKLRPDYSAMLLQDYRALPALAPALGAIPEYMAWMRAVGGYL